MVVVPGAVVESEDGCRTVLERINCGADGEGVAGADYETCQADTAGTPCETFVAEGQQYTGVPPVRSCDFL